MNSNIPQHDADNQQFIWSLENGVAKIDYRILPNQHRQYYHIFVPPEYRGKNIAKILSEFAFNFAIERQWTVEITCPYLRAYALRNREKLASILSPS